MNVVRARVRWVESQRESGVVYFHETSGGNAACFPSRNNLFPPDIVHAGARTHQPKPGDEEECVLVMLNGKTNFFAYPIASNKAEQTRSPLEVEDAHGFHHISNGGAVEVTVHPEYNARVEAWAEKSAICIVVRELK